MLAISCRLQDRLYATFITSSASQDSDHGAQGLGLHAVRAEHRNPVRSTISPSAARWRRTSGSSAPGPTSDRVDSRWSNLVTGATTVMMRRVAVAPLRT
jgi:hypothetical protein